MYILSKNKIIAKVEDDKQQPLMPHVLPVKSSLTDVEILNDDLGCPHVLLTGKAIELFDRLKAKKIHISISHSKDYAVATCIIEN